MTPTRRPVAARSQPHGFRSATTRPPARSQPPACALRTKAVALAAAVVAAAWTTGTLLVAAPDAFAESGVVEIACTTPGDGVPIQVPDPRPGGIRLLHAPFACTEPRAGSGTGAGLVRPRALYAFTVTNAGDRPLTLWWQTLLPDGTRTAHQAGIDAGQTYDVPATYTAPGPGQVPDAVNCVGLAFPAGP